MNNIQDLMQLEQAFRLTEERVLRVRGKMEQDLEGLEGPATVDELDALFRHYPEFMVEGSAPGWSAVFHFKIAEVGAWTLSVRGGVATTAKGLEGEPTCVVETDAELLVALLLHEQKQTAETEEEDEELSDAQLETVAGGKVETSLGDLPNYSPFACGSDTVPVTCGADTTPVICGADTGGAVVEGGCGLNTPIGSDESDGGSGSPCFLNF